ncbi:glucose 1-dehydrogenase [Halorussus salilacus]|uniref:glucose 1-dehydrogenase n=1 Tax=Halorussus salilacus TaxID=2953750 RepID=UPI00209CD292|nr:glucose 1-dehydrogenase [Halorussus salilacus]USZ68997.1 glucose 1-dehydrogenase [Halorussus salilacus]
MEAVVIRRGASSPAVEELPRPDPDAGEVLVRTLRVGVDGTDHEVIEGSHGGYPEGDDYLVLGHEAVGVVADANGTAFEAGDVVAPTVRRPPADGPNEYFERGEPDMAPPEACVERGIDGAHGFMAEYFTSPAEYLVHVPEELAEWGFLVEPASITEKALEHAAASRSAFDWTPESALVLGNGSLGLLTLAMLVARGYDRTYCLGRRDRPDPTIDVIEKLGATYIDSRVTPVPEVPAAHEPMDLVYEATGYARHAFESIEALAPGGVAALLGVPDPWRFEVDGGRLHEELVMTNKALVGSVNSNTSHFAAAVETLADLPAWFLDDLVTGVHGLDDCEAAFADGDETTIKTAVQFAQI